MNRPHLLMVLVLLTLTAAAALPLFGQRAHRRALAAGATRTIEDPLIAWVASLRHDAPAPAGRRRSVRDAAPPADLPGGGIPAEPAEAPGGDAAERSSGPAGRAVAHRSQEARRPIGEPGSLDPSRPAGQGPPTGPPPRRDSRRPGGAPPPAAGGRRAPTSAGASPTGREPAPARRWGGAPVPAPVGPLMAAPRRTLLVAGVAAAALGAVLGGPVAAAAAGAYGALGVRALLKRRAARHAERARRHHLDQLCDLAADLRAGLPVGQAMALSTGGESAGGLVRAAVQLADRTGAPLAELLERIDVDARAADRGLASAAAQAAGAKATAWLLASLPLGGIGLGYAIGVDPVAVLLHTPVGGGCAVLAVVLQVAGLLWAERLTSIPRRDLG